MVWFVLEIYDVYNFRDIFISAIKTVPEMEKHRDTFKTTEIQITMSIHHDLSV